MELSRKLQICEQRRRKLQDQLYDLQTCWKSRDELFELRKLKESKTRRRLKDCLEKKSVVDRQCDDLTENIDEMGPSWKRLKNLKDVQALNKGFAAPFEYLQKSIEEKNNVLQTTEQQVRELAEKKKSLSMQLSELRHRCRAKRGEHSASAAAQGRN